MMEVIHFLRRKAIIPSSIHCQLKLAGDNEKKKSNNGCYFSLSVYSFSSPTSPHKQPVVGRGIAGLHALCVYMLAHMLTNMFFLTHVKPFLFYTKLTDWLIVFNYKNADRRSMSLLPWKRLIAYYSSDQSDCWKVLAERNSLLQRCFNS